MGRPTSDQNDPVIAEAIRLRERGFPIARIAQRLGGSHGTWHWRFLVHGVEPGGIPHQRPKAAPFDGHIQAMRGQGMLVQDIARTIGRGRTYVVSRLMRIGRQEAFDEAQQACPSRPPVTPVLGNTLSGKRRAFG